MAVSACCYRVILSYYTAERSPRAGVNTEEAMTGVCSIGPSNNRPCNEVQYKQYSALSTQHHSLKHENPLQYITTKPNTPKPYT